MRFLRSRKLILITLTIWVGAGVFLFVRCSSEKREILVRANRSRRRMAAVFYIAVARLSKIRDRKRLRLLIGNTGRSYAKHLKTLRSLEKKLFWSSLDGDPESQRQIRSLSNARAQYREAMKTRQRRK